MRLLLFYIDNSIAVATIASRQHGRFTQKGIPFFFFSAISDSMTSPFGNLSWMFPSSAIRGGAVCSGMGEKSPWSAGVGKKKGISEKLRGPKQQDTHLTAERACNFS
jgi:hypothetical protein